MPAFPGKCGGGSWRHRCGPRRTGTRMRSVPHTPATTRPGGSPPCFACASFADSMSRLSKPWTARTRTFTTKQSVRQAIGKWTPPGRTSPHSSLQGEPTSPCCWQRLRLWRGSVRGKPQRSSMPSPTPTTRTSSKRCSRPRPWPRDPRTRTTSCATDSGLRSIKVGLEHRLLDVGAEDLAEPGDDLAQRGPRLDQLDGDGHEVARGVARLPLEPVQQEGDAGAVAALA